MPRSSIYFARHHSRGSLQLAQRKGKDSNIGLEGGAGLVATRMRNRSRSASTRKGHTEAAHAE